MNKMEALKYLIDTNTSYTDEWTEAGMYHALKDIIESKKEEFEKEELDVLLQNAEHY